MARTSTLASAALAALLLVSACGDTGVTTTAPPPDPPATLAPTTTTPAPVTTAAPTTTTPAPTTTAAPTTTQPPTTSTTTPPTTVDTNTLASGSGCTPGEGALPDGRWFGTIVDAGADSIEFDLACWFSGDAAVKASAEDGEESPPPNDYYIRNVNPQTRDVPVAGDAAVRWLENPGGAELSDISYADWLANREARFAQPNAWLEIEGGEVALVEEQYQP